MLVVVKSKKGNRLYLRQIEAQGTEPNIQLMSGENAKIALDRALGNSIKLLFQDEKFISSLL